MVFGVDDLIFMGAIVAGKEIYKHYEQKKRTARLSSIRQPERRSPTPEQSPTSERSPTPPVQRPLVIKATQSTTKGDVYSSCPVGDDETRVLTLKGGREGIELEFSSYNLETDLHDFHALSYSWEDGKDPNLKIKDSRFTVNGIVWEISENIYQAFVSLKQQCEDEDMLVWVDEICIDQSDGVEKKQQVALMRKIYSAAATVVVWLGPATPASDHFLSQFDEDDSYDALEFQSCHKYFDGYAPHLQSCGPQCTQARDLGAGLLNRRWWRRTWVIQEVMLNREVWVLCGTKTILFDALLVIAQFAVQNNYQTLPLPEEGSLEHFTAYQDGYRHPLGTLLHMRERVLADDDVDFTEWIEVFHKQDTTLPRDKLYGLFGLADPEKYKDFPITYEKTEDVNGNLVFKTPDEAVFTMATKAVVEASKKLDFICLTQRGGADRGLPSWVPDFRRRPHYSYAHWPLNYMSQPTFKASIRPACAGWDDECMFATGFLVDMIADVGLVDNWHDDIDGDRLDPNCEDPFRAHAMEMTFAMNASSPQWNALAKTIVCDMDDAGRRLKPDEDGFSMQTIQDALPHFQPTSDVPGAWPAEAARVWREKAKHRWTSGRRFVTTEQGRLGIAPADTQPGDLVCILDGATVPYILRKLRDTRAAPEWTENYIFLGESYVHGVMDGELKDLGLSSDCFPIV